jgi:hypothetical protein
VTATVFDLFDTAPYPSFGARPVPVAIVTERAPMDQSVGLSKGATGGRGGRSMSDTVGLCVGWPGSRPTCSRQQYRAPSLAPVRRTLLAILSGCTRTVNQARSSWSVAISCYRIASREPNLGSTSPPSVSTSRTSIGVSVSRARRGRSTVAGSRRRHGIARRLNETRLGWRPAHLVRVLR